MNDTDTVTLGQLRAFAKHLSDDTPILIYVGTDHPADGLLLDDNGCLVVSAKLA